MMEVTAFRERFRNGRLVFWWIAFVLSGTLSCVMFLLFIAFVSERLGMTTWDIDPFILDAQIGVCCVIMFAVTTILAILRYPQMKRTAQAGIAATGFTAVLAIIVSYCVIYLPSPYINQVDYNEPTKDPYVFFALIMGAVVPWAVCLVFYSAIRRIREKRGVKCSNER